MLILKINYMKGRYLRHFVLYSVIALLLTACNRNKFDIRVEKIVDINVYRLDSMFFDPPVDQVVENVNLFYEQFPEFAEVYFKGVLNIGGIESRYFKDYFKLFLSNPDFRESYDSTKVAFGDFKSKRNEIELAFDYLRHYLSDLHVPDIYTMISGFNESVVLFDDAVAVSLEKFLGSGSLFYEKLAAPKYLRKRYNPELLSAEVVRSWLGSEYSNGDSVRNLVNTMIYHGKIMYLMDAAFPKKPDYFKISYLPDEIIWAQKSEKYIWAYFIDKKLLFATDEKSIGKYIEEAPFVPDFGDTSPGRIGVWMGWQIVRSYMNKNSQVSIEELLRINDHQQILLQSGYSPR